MRGFAIFLLSLATFWGHEVHGALRCEALFERQQPSLESAELEAVIRQAHEIENLLVNRNTRGPDQLNQAVQTYEKSVALYLNSAGIPYKVKAPVSAGGSQSFILHGNPQGDKVARLLYTAEIHAKRAGHPLEIRFEPFFDFRGGTAASFLADTTWTMTFGPQALELQLAGFEHPLRHELQHLFEQIKIENGGFSLAQLELSNAVAHPEPYQNFLRLDEAESFLRDLHFQMNEDERNIRFSSPVAKKIRHDMIQAKLNLLRRVLRDSRSTLSSMQDLLKVGALQAQARSRRGSLTIYHFVSLPNSPYPAVSLSLRTDISHPEQLKRESLGVVQKSLTRISEIERELGLLVKGSLS